MPDDSPTIKLPTEEPRTLPDIPTSWERYTVLIVFATVALYMMWKGNSEAAITALGTIATYFLSRTGA